MKRLSLMLMFMLIPSFALAQNTTSFAWQAGDLALTYPADWQEPEEIDGTLVLKATAEDIDGVPTIILSRTASSSADLYTQLQTAFNEIDVIPTGPLDAELINFSAVSTSGSSPDGSLYAVGRIARLADTTTVQIIGTVATTERDAFLAIFNSVADSLSLGATSTPRISSDYGVLWQANSADGDTFDAVVGLAYAPDDILYVLDAQLGIVPIDGQTGEVQDIFRPSIVAAPSDIAVDPDGVIYVTDLACSCVIVLTFDGTENGTIDGFSARDHMGIALAVNGRTIVADDNGINSSGRIVATVPANSLLGVDSDGRIIVFFLMVRFQRSKMTPSGH